MVSLLQGPAHRLHHSLFRRAVARVAVPVAAERLGGRAELCVATCAGIDREDRRAGEAKQVVVLERLDDSAVHVAELGAVALVEDDDDVAVEYGGGASPKK